MDFFDILLAKKLEDDRDPKVEGLSVTANGTYSEDGVVYKPVVVNVPETPLSSLAVTANGTYTAPTGTGYNVVNVNVPLPENAYLLEEYEDVPTDIASFTASDLPLKSLTASIEPVQAGSGDPSPSNVRPISGWSAVDVNVVGKNWWVKGNINGTTTYDVTGLYIPIGTWTLSANVTSDDKISNKCLIYDLTQGYVRELGSIERGNRKYITFTTDHVITGIRFYASTTFNLSQGHIFAFTDVQLEEGSVATEYEPYSGTTTIPFTDGQGQSVEVFGGSVDVVNGGEQPKTLNGVDLGDFNWQYRGDIRTGLFSASSLTDYKHMANVYALCELYKFAGTVTDVGVMPYKNNGDICFFNSSEYPSDSGLYIIDERFTNASDFKNAVSGLKLVYELATPTTFYTQPTSIKSLDGENIVFASTGQIEDLEFFTKETS